MKIGQITVSYKPLIGGQEVYIDLLAKVLRDVGHSVRIYQPDTGIKDKDLFLSPNPNYPKGLEKLIPRLMRYNFSLFTHQLKNLKKEDLLIIHYPEHYLPVAWHKKTVVLTHGINWELNSPLKRISREFLAKLAFERAWKFVANDTNFLRAMGLDIKPKEKMFQEVSKGRWFIPNCVDTEFFTVSRGLRQLKKLNPIIVPRNLSKARGVDLAVDAFELIADKYQELNLVIVGKKIPLPDSTAYFEKLVSKVDSSPYKHRIIFLGSKPWNEMKEIYSSALVTLVPTRASEGTSLAALESMACGTATVTTSVAGLRDLPSIQTEPNPSSIAAALEDTIKNREEIGAAQQIEVRKDFNLDNWKKAWLKLIS